MRRIATDRPATDAVVVRVIMISVTDVPSGSLDPRALFALQRGTAADCSAHRTARCREPERIDWFLTRGVKGEQVWLDQTDATTGDNRNDAPKPRFRQPPRTGRAASMPARSRQREAGDHATAPKSASTFAT